MQKVGMGRETDHVRQFKITAGIDNPVLSRMADDDDDDDDASTPTRRGYAPRKMQFAESKHRDEIVFFLFHGASYQSPGLHFMTAPLQIRCTGGGVKRKKKRRREKIGERKIGLKRIQYSGLLNRARVK